jgi:ABC-type lipoprotein release transport system permease subunit
VSSPQSYKKAVATAISIGASIRANSCHTKSATRSTSTVNRVMVESKKSDTEDGDNKTEKKTDQDEEDESVSSKTQILLDKRLAEQHGVEL